MTSLSSEDVSCCVCGNTSSQTVMQSTSQFGPPDLDTRPGEMMRSSIGYWLQRCPDCSYCAADITECGTDTDKIVRSQEYQRIAGDSRFPRLATAFLANSYEKEQTHEYSEAAWRAIHAAWICDDAEEDDAAIECRKLAIGLVDQCAANSQTLSTQAGSTEAITVDLMRRAGQFKEAKTLAEQARNMNIGELVDQVIEYEEGLIERHDVQAHSVAEVLGGSD